MKKVFIKIITNKKYCGIKCFYLKQQPHQRCKLFQESLWWTVDTDKYKRCVECNRIVKTKGAK